MLSSVAGGCLILILTVAHEVGQLITLNSFFWGGMARVILLWTSFPFSAFFLIFYFLFLF